MTEFAYLLNYDYLGKKHKVILPATSVPDAHARLTAIHLTGEVTGQVLGEIKGDSRLLVKLFGEEP